MSSFTKALLPLLRERFEASQLRFPNSEEEPIAVVVDVHPTFGGVAIFDDEEELTICFGGSHLHVGWGEGTESRSALAVIKIIEALQSIGQQTSSDAGPSDLLDRAVSLVVSEAAGLFGAARSL